MKRAKDAGTALREMGYRLTPQRMMVVAAIEDSDNHISAEEICSEVKATFPQVNISTVYRTLDLLKSLGLVMETDMGEGRVRYHPPDKGHHDHLVCRLCGRVIDLQENSLFSLRKSL